MNLSSDLKPKCFTSKINEITFRADELKITSSDLSIQISGRKGSLPPELEEIAATMLKTIGKYEIFVGFIIYNATLTDAKLQVEQEIMSVGNTVNDLLSGVEQVAIFACTVEKKLDEFIRSITDPVDLYLADVIGTLLIEKSLKKLKEHLKSLRFKLHTNLTNTICPGNCGWDIMEQNKLFRLLPESFLGISINEYGMMNPVKSINGIVGMGEQVHYRKTNCKSCDSRNCWYRKA
ncbi:hypothetical protein [Mangrovibacterium sp.]|uniref:hypothetical protein n=1 Tax=Mangrovibacterium sp. TaxID=1961364 RepID=UPI0035639650